MSLRLIQFCIQRAAEALLLQDKGKLMKGCILPELVHKNRKSSAILVVIYLTKHESWTTVNSYVSTFEFIRNLLPDTKSGNHSFAHLNGKIENWE